VQRRRARCDVGVGRGTNPAAKHNLEKSRAAKRIPWTTSERLGAFQNRHFKRAVLRLGGICKKKIVAAFEWTEFLKLGTQTRKRARHKFIALV
jgi:hypothetical protein